MKIINRNRFLKLFICFLLLVISLLSFSVSADVKIPTPTTYKYLNDYAHLINETQLNSIISIGKPTLINTISKYTSLVNSIYFSN